jgi:acetyl-CoA carboxylase biotin carboxyl carrier protein
MSENPGSAKAAEEKQQEQQAGRGRHRRRSASKKKHGDPSLNMAEIRELADLVDAHGFTDFEFENENIRIRLSKNPAPQYIQAVQPVQNAPAAQPSAPSAETGPAVSGAAETASSEADEDAGLHLITSPIVGTFYRAPAPDKEPYVKEGSKVTPDTVVCIVEAMKLMNEIQAEVSGEVVKIYVENGQPVEYGQPLFGIKQ